MAPPYYVLLMLPFMAYGVVLLGLNLLFGYTGLVSFGHALFIGIGAYAGAFLTDPLGVRSLEVILLAAGVLGARWWRRPVGALCVRYVKIYFGMLTLAFGMVFYTFLLKFYRLTGGDEGMRVLRPSLLGLELGAMPKTDYLIGPYYYYSLGGARPGRRSSCGGSCTRRSASACGRSATTPPRPRALGIGVHALPLVRLRDLGRLRRGGRRAPGPAHRQRRSHARLLDALRQYRLHDAARRLRAASSARSWAPSSSSSCRTP